MVDFVGAVGAATSALQVIKELSQISKAYDEGALKLRIAELSGSLLQMQIALTDAQREIMSKDAKIAELTAVMRAKNENTIEAAGFLYRKHSDGKPVGTPYCPVCIHDGRMIAIARIRKNDLGYVFQCPKCKADFDHLSEYSER